jgi:hypothetical protein
VGGVGTRAAEGLLDFHVNVRRSTLMLLRFRIRIGMRGEDMRFIREWTPCGLRRIRRGRYGRILQYSCGKILDNTVD